MKHVVTFETAQKLKAAGFPQHEMLLPLEGFIFIPSAADILKEINNPLVLIAYEEGRFTVYLHPDSDIFDVLATDEDLGEALGKAYLKLKGVEYSNTDRPKI